MTIIGPAKYVIVLFTGITGVPHIGYVGNFATREECVEHGNRLSTGMWNCITTDRVQLPKNRLGEDLEFRQ